MLIVLLVILSTAGLWVFVRYAPALGLVDHPNDRSLHGTPTVVGAGVVPVTLIALYLAMTASFPGAGILATVLMGLTAMGLADDRWGLPSAIRLICYLLAGLILARILLPDYAFISLPVVLAAVAVAWCMNLYNFMDGADGFAVARAGSIDAIPFGQGALAAPVELELPEGASLAALAIDGDRLLVAGRSRIVRTLQFEHRQVGLRRIAARRRTSRTSLKTYQPGDIGQVLLRFVRETQSTRVKPTQRAYDKWARAQREAGNNVPLLATVRARITPLGVTWNELMRDPTLAESV